MFDALNRAVGRTAFGADVAGYAAGRLGYPDRLFDILADGRGLGVGAQVLEIGPGTGQATRRLLDAGAARVTCVEPDAQLAAHLRGWGDARLVVENKPFGADVSGDGTFDLIVAATSFHWLEAGPALAHVGRLLRPGGTFAMWWNVFHEAGEDTLFANFFEGLARPPSLTSGQHYSLDAVSRSAELTAAGMTEVEHTMLSRAVDMTPASLRALFATFSAVRQLQVEEREIRLDALEEQARREHGEHFKRIVRTPLYTGRAAA